MLTDWLIVRRLAAELDRAVRGARIREAGRLAGGRFGLRLPRQTLALDAFGPTPIVTLQPDAPLERAAGWVRTTADALEGLRIDAVRARRGDRLIAFECSARSRFGVESGYRLVAELVPRFGNIVLLKDDTVVTAAKEFTRAENARRATLAGETYEPPPLHAPSATGPSLGEALTALAHDDAPAQRQAASAALRAAVPLVPRLIAESLIAESMFAVHADPGQLARRCIARATALVDGAAGAPDGLGDVFVYHDGARLIQCHVVPLVQYAALAMTRVADLLPVLADAVDGATRTRTAQALHARRASLLARIEKRRTLLTSERTTLERERDDAAARDTLRRAGELLYAHIDEVPPHVRQFVPPSAPDITIALEPELDARANAAAIFRRYRKAVAKLEHVSKRLDELARDARFAEQLAWEVERADAESLDDVAEAVQRLERRNAAAPKTTSRRRKPLEIRLADDARAFVGRSPAGNADLTFRIARPDDLWFHVRGTPGAHVVLHIDTARPATPGELETAASLAAYHSKARGSEKVSVDYTERKHVRRQQHAPPGLVWYTGARSLHVAPSPGDGAPRAAEVR